MMLTLALLTVAGAAAGGVATLLSGKITPSVEVPVHTTAEARVLAALLHSSAASVARYTAVSGVGREHFALPEHVTLWERIQTEAIAHQEAPVAAGHHSRLIASSMSTLPDGVVEARTTIVDGKTLAERDAEDMNAALSAPDSAVADALTNWLPSITLDDVYRSRVDGDRAGLVTAAATPTWLKPLTRNEHQPTGRQYAAGAATGAAIGAAWAAGATMSGVPSVPLLALCYITVAVMVAQVDHFTRMLHAQTFVPAAVATYVVYGLHVLAGIMPLNLPGLLMPLLIVGLLEGLRIVFLKVRGVDSHGLGDSIAMPMLLGIPWAVATAGTADLAYELGMYASWTVSLFAASILVYGLATGGIKNRKVPALPFWAVVPVLGWPAIAIAVDTFV